MSAAELVTASAWIEDVACNLCGARNAHVLYPSTLGSPSTVPDPGHFRCTTAAYGVHPAIVRCNQCGLTYANPRFTSRLVEHQYSAVDDPLYIEERAARVLTFRRNFTPLEALARATHIPPLRLLDVGSHIGVLLEIAQARGWDAVGVEPSAWAAQRARERGLAVINTTLAGAHLSPASFDAVTLWDVIEHLTDPAADLRRVHRLLKPRGIIGIHTIDVESVLARVMGNRWPWFMIMHLYYFAPRTLSRMLTESGFTVERIMRQGRYLRVNYLVTRIRPFSQHLAQVAQRFSTRLNLGALAIPINTFDVFTILARKKD